MKKAVLFSLLAALLLAACNAAETPRPTRTPDPNAVATNVSQLLTAQPTPTRQAVTLTPIPSATQVPTGTPLPPTAPPTLTPLPATATPASTSTVSPEDPVAALGNPTWKNTFDGGRAFALDTPYEDENVSLKIENGRMTMTGRQATGWHSWRLTAPQIQNVYLEAQVQTRDCSGSDTYGLVVRAPDYDSGRGYYYGVTCDGRFTFGVWKDESVVDLIGLTQHSAIKAGPNQDNRIGIKAEGSRFSLYANGKLMQQIEDRTFDAAGNFGAWIAAFRTAGFTVEYDQMSYWKLP